MILACQNICKTFGSRNLIKNASFHVEDREKAAIVGINGVGKSTLLKIIMKEIDADSGEVIIAKGKTIGILLNIRTLWAKIPYLMNFFRFVRNFYPWNAECVFWNRK